MNTSCTNKFLLTENYVFSFLCANLNHKCVLACHQVEPDICEPAANSQFTQVSHKEDKTWNSMKHTAISPTQELQTQPPLINPRQSVSEHSRVTHMTTRESSIVPEKTVCPKLPRDVDPEVFKLLPEHIQMELISSFQREGSAQLNYGAAETSSDDVDPAAHSTSAFKRPTTEPCDRNPASHNHELSKTLSSAQSAVELNSGLDKATENHDIPSATQAPQSDVPANVDPYVFSQLPADVQRELLTEWRQQKPVLKIPSKHSHKTSNTKDKKSAAKGSQCNDILKYFKPNWGQKHLRARL